MKTSSRAGFSVFIEDKSLSAYPHIKHGFFGRKGGVSAGLYNSLNVGFGTKDDPAHIVENRTRVAKALGATPDKLVTLHQVHSADCVYVSAPFAAGKAPEADAMVTDVAGIALGVLTADCVPVLFYGEKADGAPVIGAAHAGWGGAFKGVLAATVAMMRDKGAIKVSAAIGPCIQQNSYEVGNDFMARFIEQSADNQQFFMDASRDDHQMFDLPAYAAHCLRHADVEMVSDIGVDTYTHDEGYFSYRRATHKDEPDYGRQISAIVIKS